MYERNNCRQKTPTAPMNIALRNLSPFNITKSACGTQKDSNAADNVIVCPGSTIGLYNQLEYVQ